MEEREEKNPIKNIFEQDMLLLLVSSGEIFPLLKEMGLGVEEGITIFTETYIEKEYFLSELKKLGVITYRSISRQSITEKYRNYRINLYVEKRYDSEEGIYNFLNTDECLPVVLTSGKLPEYAQGKNLLIFNGETATEMISEELLKQIGKFRLYVHKHPAIVLRELRLLKKSESFRENTVKDGSMQKMFKATGEVWRTFFIEEHDEKESNMVRKRLWQTVDAFTELAEEYTSAENVADLVGKMLLKYVKEHDDIEICDLTNIDLRITEKIQKKKAILQDREFYYISEELLRSACQPLLGVISFLTIKKNCIVLDI